MTLYFNHIGRLGQLGNQMFQYASLKGIAKHRGFDYAIPFYSDVFVDELGNKLRTQLFEPFNFDVKIDGIKTEKYIQEPHFQFSQELFDKCPDNVSLYGFFQTEKYFKNVEDIIREDFTFKDNILHPCQDMMQGILEQGSVIGLHIRRKDYLTNPNHHFVGIDYYKRALEKFSNDVNVLVFSDDPKWCHQQSLFEDDRFMISENDSGYVDMCLMSMCTDFIIGNSSFSWWAAWLGNKGKVIAPKNWFPDSKDTSDLYCDNWEVI